LWAEAREVYELAGIDWMEAETLARDVHAEHKISDPWTTVVDAWLKAPDEFDEKNCAPESREFLQAMDVLQGALGMDAKSVSKREEMRIGKVLQALGYERERIYLGGTRKRVWIRTTWDNL